MKKLMLIFFILLFSFPAFPADTRETAFQRVKRTNILRCGYLVWPPFMDKDLKSGKFSGLNYDYTEAVAKSLDLKVDWALEVVSGDQVEALKSGKIDAICTAEGPLVPTTAKFLHYSAAFGYFPFFAYARADDDRFDRVGQINHPNIRVALIDGDASGFVTNIHFPRAKRYALPQFASPGQMMLDVAANKADIVINDPLSMQNYMTSNPGKLKKISTEKPIAVIPNTFSVLLTLDSGALITLLNQGIGNIRHYGEEDLILAPYEKAAPGAFYRASHSWQNQETQ